MRLFIEIVIVLFITIVLPVVIAHLKERKEELQYRKRELEKEKKIQARKEWEESIIEGKLSLYGDFELTRPNGMYEVRNSIYIESEEEVKTLQVYCHRDNRWKSAIINGEYIPLLEVEEERYGFRVVIDPIYNRLSVRYKMHDIFYEIVLTRKY